MDRLYVASRRRRSLSLVVRVYFVVVVADFTRHHSVAASATDVAEQPNKLSSQDLDDDENELIIAAKGTGQVQVASCLLSATLHFWTSRALQVSLYYYYYCYYHYIFIYLFIHLL